jgi:hypothetical protein
MKKNILAAYLLFTATVLGNVLQGASDWVKYDSEQGRYSLLFPSQPKLTAQGPTSPDDKQVAQYRAQASDSNGLYMVIYSDYPPDLEFSFDKARDAAVATVRGRLLSEKTISLGGNPGREWTTLTKPSVREHLIRARVYKVGKRVYILQHLFYKSSDTEAQEEKKTIKFFDSFKVTNDK